MFSLAEAVRKHAIKHPDKPALVCDDRTLTFAEFHMESSQVANALLDAGVEPGDRVGFIGKNIAEYYTLTYGAAKLNAINVAVNWRLAPPEMDFILDDAEAKVVIIEAEFLDHIKAMKLPHVPLVVVIGGESDNLKYGDWVNNQSTNDPNHSTMEDDTILLVYTSGTTGLPKGAEISSRNMGGIAKPIIETFNYRPNSVILLLLPMFHIGGCAVGHTSLYVGCTNVIHREFDPVRIFNDIPRHQVTLLAMVPAMLQALPTIPGAADVDFSSLEQIAYGGSPITEEVLLASLALFKCGHAQMYGATEAGIMSCLTPEDHDPGGPRAELMRSAGKPIGGVELRIIGANGDDLSDGEVGEIWTRSYQTTKAYWKNPEATAAAYPEGRDADGLGWFATGDAGYLKNGFLFIQDRVKDMIISGGENIYPAEIENVIMSHPAVADVAVIGVPSERWGESPLAFVVPAGNEPPSHEELIKFCAKRLAKFKLPAEIELIDEIPRNPSGKILKTKLREPYWEGRGRITC